MKEVKKVLVTGGAGYVGAVLVPKLIEAGYAVTVVDLFLYGDDVLDSVKDNPNLTLVKGDIRDVTLLEETIPGCDAVIHLACISNDPSFELNPDLGKSINFDCFPDLVRISKENSVRRFIYASSSSVYGIKETQNVTEDLPLEPLTDYSKYKAACEEILLEEMNDEFIPFIVRPATVCGYSPRLRLDLTVNILTSCAVNNGKITVFGGEQLRPNIHIDDISRVYVEALSWPEEKIKGKIYNCGYENHKVSEIASMVKNAIGDRVEIETTESDDKRSYHISSAKIKDELGFEPEFTIQDAIDDLVEAFDGGKIPDALNDSRYYNIRTMQEVKLS